MTSTSNQSEKMKFGSFAVLDFETSNLPEERFFKVGLTELSIYGIAASEFNSSNENAEGHLVQPPELPRVLHKLTLMINPMMGIDPESERVSGLNNYMLEAESKFDENAGNMLLAFLNHLQQPVCLVAHNGYTFDFPILKYVLKRNDMSLPNTVFALDSLRAFHDIDKTLEIANQKLDEKENKDEFNVGTSSTTANLNINEQKNIENKEVNLVTIETETEVKHEEEILDACSQNETTPKRPIRNEVRKRKLLEAGDIDAAGTEHSTPRKEHSRRRLNFGDSPTSSTNELRRKSGKKWFPPKNMYKLPNLFLRVFSRDPIIAHHAEADVETLTKLMLHYGLHFVDYAEEHAIPFSEVPQLGRPNNI